MAPSNLSSEAVNAFVDNAKPCNSPGAQKMLLFCCVCNMFAFLNIVGACLLQVSHTNTHPSSTHSFINENMNSIVLFVITKLAGFDAFATMKHKTGDADVAFDCQESVYALSSNHLHSLIMVVLEKLQSMKPGVGGGGDEGGEGDGFGGGMDSGDEEYEEEEKSGDDDDDS